MLFFKHISATPKKTAGRDRSLFQSGRGLGLSLFAAACLILTGCATTPKLNAPNLGEVRLDPAVTIPDEMHYMGPGSEFGFAFGAIGAAIAYEANRAPGEKFKKFAEANNIHFDQILLDEARKAFEQSGKLNLTDGQGNNTPTLRVKALVYGFAMPHAFSSTLVPIVTIVCTLTGPDGKVIWSAKDYVQPAGNPVDGKTPDELRANPQLIEEGWRTAVRTIMTNITSHM
ncbi:hypothetical protein [Radicibacter daui]|uniref:hypothetical protein n=1 Tax=Radicibacter daui TaxID=3064829 RepID=UPI004046DCF4